MKDELCKMLLSAQKGDKDNLYILIEKFKPLTDKYARQLNYYCAETDMAICLIELIQNIDWTRFIESGDGQAVNYIVRALHNKKIDLFRKNVSGKYNTVHFDAEQMSQIAPSTIIDFMDTLLEWTDILHNLTESQRKILLLEYISGYSNAEIARKLGVTRQAVFRCKKRAIKKELYP